MYVQTPSTFDVNVNNMDDNQSISIYAKQFIATMSMIGNKHKSYEMNEKILKILLQCLINVFEKIFKDDFHFGIKRALQITFKLGIKVMFFKKKEAIL